MAKDHQRLTMESDINQNIAQSSSVSLSSTSTTRGDDEGYTSPSEEDFRYNPIPFGVRLEDTAHFTCPSTSKAEEKIPWDEISRIPYIPNRHLTWDNLQAPVPFRYQPSHAQLYKKSLEKPIPLPFLSDSREKSTQLVDTIWKISKPDLQEQVKGSCEQTDLSNAVAHLKQSLEKPIYIPLKQLIQHVFHLLSGRESLTFLVDEKALKFTKNPVVLVHGISPASLSKYCEPLVKCGSIVKRLNRYSALHYDNKLLKEEGLDRNATMTAFLRFIANYLKLYQTILMLNSSSITSLTRLMSFVRPFRRQLETLEFILDNNPSGSAVRLLSSLNRLLFCDETPFISDLIRGLFVTCASAYLKYVSNWIFRGNLGPPSEFHIERLCNSTYRDRRFWTKQFSQGESVPMFLEESVELIFETGKAINLLNQIQDENIFATIPLFCYDTDVLLSPVLAFEDVMNLQSLWNTKLEDFWKEQSYLIQDISSSINQLLNYQNEGIDFDAIKEVKEEREKKLLAQKLAAFENQKRNRKELLEMLQEQVAQSKAKKIQDVKESRIQEQKDRDYLEMRDKRDADEEKRIRFKHFGDVAIHDPNNRKDTFSRLHSAPAGYAKVNQDVPLCNAETELSKSANETIPATRQKIQHLEKPRANFQFRACGDAGDQIDFGSSDKVSDLEISGQSDADLDSNIDGAGDEVEEKFNPDMVVTKDPPPYQTCISLDSASSRISFLEFMQSNDALELESANEVSTSTRYDPHCLNQFFSQSVLIPLNAQNRMVNASLLHYFICEKNLFYHVEALNDFLCLQNGLFGHSLSNLLIQEVSLKNMRTKEDVVSKSGRLNLILAESISTSVANEDQNEFVRNLGFTINKDFRAGEGKEKSITSEYEILDCVRLCYTVEWPLNIILTDDLLRHYERLFVFLMQLFRAELLLQQVYSILKFKNNKSHQLFSLHQYRYRLLHFVRTVRNYVNVTVIHTTWTELCASFSKMNSLEKLYEYLVRHIKTINTNCLLGVKAEGVMKLLKSQLVIIETFCSQLERVASNIDWAKGEEIPAKEYKKLVQKFKAVEEIGKVFTEVAYKLVNKGYYPRVSYFLELYNFNGYFQNKA